MKNLNPVLYQLMLGFLVISQLLFSQTMQAQCNVDYVEVCNSGGTFGNWTNMDIIASCLDNVNSNEGAYVVFNVVTGGELNVSVEGLPNGNNFMDVAVYTIPSGTAPCDAPVQISCNFAATNSDCASFGGGLGCASDVAGPMVNTGDRIMVLAHDYNNVYSSFSVAVGTGAGKAVLGPPLIDLQPTGPLQEDGVAVVVNTGSNHAGGGVWSASCGACINSSTGFFDPTAAGAGTHTVTYTHYTLGNPCYSTASIDIDVNAAPTFTSPNTATFSENGTGIAIDVQSTDDTDAEPTGLTYSIVAGNDGSLFAIDADDGELRFLSPPDFENPTDGNMDNDYVVEVQVCDSQGGCSTQVITISVTEVVEAVLDMTLTVKPEVCPGGIAAYFLTIENNSGENDAVGITIADVLPTDFTFYADTIELLNGATQTIPTPQPAFGDGGTINWGTFDIPDGATVTIAYNALVDIGATNGIYSNNITGTVATFNPISVSGDITVGGTICDTPVPFVCEPAFYQVYKKTGESSKFAKLNPSDGFYTEIASVTSPVNAMGLDVTNGFVYGAVKNRFVRMDGNGTILDMGIALPANCYAGDVDENGFWYGKVGPDMIKIDLNGASPSVVATYAGQSLPGADMSYNIDGNFYAVAGQTVYKFDTSTNTKSTVGTVTGATLPGGAYGAQWTGSDGRLYMSSNSTGEIYRISVTNLDARLVMQTITGLKSNDGFSCPTELPAPFGYEYGDKLGAGQARHLAFTEDFSNDDIPDFSAVWLGAKVDADATDPANATATGDTNDDGLTIPLNVLPGMTANFDMNLNTNMTGVTAHYGLYLDWNADGIFEDFYGGSAVISGATTETVVVNVPVTFLGGNPVARVRVGEEALSAANSTGDLDIGETEDYEFSPNVPPVITSAATASYQENGTGVPLDVQSTDFEGETEGTGLVYSIVGGVDMGIFTIDADDGELHFVTSPDFENPTDSDGNNEYIVDVQVCDSGGACSVQMVTITVTNENEPPEVTAMATVNYPENGTAVVVDASTIDDTDSEGSGLTYSLTGTDATLFNIDANGNVTFITSPDFENPTDSDGDNIYDVIVNVEDSGGLTDATPMAIAVTNANEAPEITSDGGGITASTSIDENETAITTVTATDIDAGDTQSYSISGGPDGSLFSISPTGELIFTTAPDFENPTDVGMDNVYEVEVTVTDAGGLTDVQTISITINDVDEDGDGFLGADDPDDSDVCVPNNADTNCCEAAHPEITKD